jgi:hypothetical protein
MPKSNFYVLNSVVSSCANCCGQGEVNPLIKSMHVVLRNHDHFREERCIEDESSLLSASRDFRDTYEVVVPMRRSLA